MKIEAVTVCIDFSKKLEKCISNKHLFDRWIIATHKTDHDTIKLCKQHNLEYVCCERVFDNANFAKGRAINDAIIRCTKTDWLIHLDADVKLRPDFRRIAEKYCVKKSALYGMPRFYENNLLKTPNFKNKIINRQTNQTIRSSIGRLGAIGYFQMWHSCKRKTYEENSTNGANDDIKFMLSFKPNFPKNNFKENWITLPTYSNDVSGFQGHHKRHYLGIRNLK